MAVTFRNILQGIAQSGDVWTDMFVKKRLQQDYQDELDRNYQLRVDAGERDAADLIMKKEGHDLDLKVGELDYNLKKDLYDSEVGAAKSREKYWATNNLLIEGKIKDLANLRDAQEDCTKALEVLRSNPNDRTAINTWQRAYDRYSVLSGEVQDPLTKASAERNLKFQVGLAMANLLASSGVDEMDIEGMSTEEVFNLAISNAVKGNKSKAYIKSLEETKSTIKGLETQWNEAKATFREKSGMTYTLEEWLVKASNFLDDRKGVRLTPQWGNKLTEAGIDAKDLDNFYKLAPEQQSVILGIRQEQQNLLNSQFEDYMILEHSWTPEMLEFVVDRFNFKPFVGTPEPIQRAQEGAQRASIDELGRSMLNPTPRTQLSPTTARQETTRPKSEEDIISQILKAGRR